jgi:hypothetical protein
MLQILDLRSGVEARLDGLLEPGERETEEGSGWA